MNSDRKFFKRTDAVVIGMVVLLGLAFWGGYTFFTRNIPPLAEIYYGEKLVASVALDGEERSFSVSGMNNVVFHLYNGGIAFERSDCPDKVCIHAGQLSRVGQSAACLPNKLILKIVDRDKNTDSNIDMYS